MDKESREPLSVDAEVTEPLAKGSGSRMEVSRIGLEGEDCTGGSESGLFAYCPSGPLNGGIFGCLGIQLVTEGDRRVKEIVGGKGVGIHLTQPHWGSQVYELESACVRFRRQRVDQGGKRK